MTRTLAVALTLVASAGTAWAAEDEERSVPYFWSNFRFDATSRAFDYEMQVTLADGTTTTGKLAITTAESAVTVSLAMDGRKDAETIRFDGAEGRPSGVSEWLRLQKTPPPSGPKRAYWELLLLSRLFDRVAPRSAWDDGFIEATPVGELVVTTTDCKGAGHAGRRMYISGKERIEGCFSPDVPYPLELVDRGRKERTVRFALERYEGPPPPRSGYAWHCDENCGPPPRRPPKIGLPAPEFAASAWVHSKGPVTVATSKEKVVVVHACRLGAPICVASAREMNELASAHPKDLVVVTLVGASDDARAGDVAEKMGVSAHVLGVQTWAQATALAQAYDLDKYPIAWVIKDGTLVWYGTRLRGDKWFAGNVYNETSRDAADPEALTRAVKAALGGAGAK